MRKEKEVLDLGEVAKLIRLSKNTVYAYTRAGRIPGAKAGNKWRYTKRQVLEALEAGFPVRSKEDTHQNL